MRPSGYVGVVGPGAASRGQVEQSVEVGRLLAEQGLVVVTGGLGGVMAGAARGCRQAGGTSLGLLPGDDRGAANPHLTLTVPTGLGEMRNALLVRTCDAVIAVGSSWGTVSEIALAARAGVPVVLLQGLRLFDEVPALSDGARPPVHVASPQEAVAEVTRLLGLGAGAGTAATDGEGAGAQDRAGAGREGECVLGVDGARGGWVGAVLPVAGAGEVRPVSGPDLATVVDRARSQGELAVVAVDTPIGLPDTGTRQADVLARRRLGRRGSSVFPTPVRDAVMAPTYAAAREVSIARTGGRSLAAQSYGLRRAILDADAYVRGRSTGPEVVEVHPELCFSVMAGAPLQHGKKSADGVGERLGLLTAQGISLPPGLDLGGPGSDDVLDAAAAAWTAARVARGEAERLPEEPERFSDGLDAAIWV